MGETLFTKELDRELKKTKEAHVTFVKNNRDMKIAFKKVFTKKTLECIFEVINAQGFDDEKINMKEFILKVDSGNYDDNDVEIFKEVIAPYIDDILDTLKKAGNMED